MIILEAVMHRKAFLLLASMMLPLGCQQAPKDTEEFKVLQLSVALVEAGANTGELLSAVQYTNHEGPAYITEAALWCDNEQKQVLSFTSDRQSIEVFSSLQGCELRLNEFRIGDQTFFLARPYQSDIFEFRSQDLSNQFIDTRLVRSQQKISQVQDCEEACHPQNVSIRFPMSTLDFRTEILTGTIHYNEVTIEPGEEDAPFCELFKVRFLFKKKSFIPYGLEIKLLNCQNTIGSDQLEFGFCKIKLSGKEVRIDQKLKKHSQILVSELPVTPIRNGDDYTITLTFDEIKSLWGKKAPKSLLDLISDFGLSVRNKGGISAIVYSIQNKTVVKTEKTP